MKDPDEEKEVWIVVEYYKGEEYGDRRLAKKHTKREAERIACISEMAIPREEFLDTCFDVVKVSD